jgi:serine/threonine-protein kinase
MTGAMISGGTVFVASSDGSLYAIDEATGAINWTVDTGSAVSAQPILAYGMVTVGNVAGAVSYLRPTTGALVSTQAFFGHPITGITATDSIILLTSGSGQLGMIQGPKYVRMIWLFSAGSGFAAAGVFLNGDIFVAGTDGLLRGFTTRGRQMT